MLGLLERRWTLRILWELRQGPLPFRIVQQRCGGLSPTLVSRRLTDLRTAGLVTPERAGYALTSLGQELGGKLLDLTSWAAEKSTPLKTQVTPAAKVPKNNP